MSKFKKVAGKAWVFGAAAAVIVGSSSIMAFAQNQNVLAASPAPSAVNLVHTSSNPPQISEGYTVIDLSKTRPSQPPSDFVHKLSDKGLTPQQIDQKYREMIAIETPDAQDMSAQQAAAYAASILKNAYGVDFTGYTADATFSKNSVPNSGNWTVIFRAPNEVQSTERYLCVVNSVTGTVLNAQAYNLSYGEESSTNLGDPLWVTAAEHDISKLLPENVSITSSKVVSATQAGGVSVVSNLSNGAAFGVRLSGENKFADSYRYFPSGYDGSWNNTGVTTANAVG